MPISLVEKAHPKQKAATTTSIILAFASVYFFWGSTYTAIRIGAAEMPALLLCGVRYVIAGALLLAWCRWRGLRLGCPPKTMLMLGVIALLLLGGGNVGLVFGEETVPSGLASLVFAVSPLYVALIEMFLPSGEPLPLRGWMGLLLGFVGLAALLWPSMHTALGSNRAMLWGLISLFAGALSWTVGSIVSRHAQLAVNTFVAAAWQMLIAGILCTLFGSALGQWPQFHLTAAAAGSLAYLVTGGSLLGYTGFIYLLEHVPVAKVTSYTYVNPVVAVLLGIVLLHEQHQASEFVGMAAIVLAVFLLTTAHVKARPQRVTRLQQSPAK